jgi:glycosyltransferase involved in cell wall biosynthesis
MKKKLTLIGPISPYRGGIAQYNTCLIKKLQNQADVQTISFRRLYPKWLYPGNKMIDDSEEKLINVGYFIDAYNPLTLRKTVKSIIEHGSSTVFITWWTLFWQPGFYYVTKKLQKKGVKVVYICHNVVDHDSGGFTDKLSTYFIKQADAYIVHASEEEKKLRHLGIIREVINTKILPIYDHYPPAGKVQKKHGKLEILFFGFIRPYKGLEVLLESIRQLDDNNIYLTVVGEVWGKKDDLKKLVKDKDIKNVELHLRYVSDEEASIYFSRCDVVALPYTSATGSAVLSLAYYYKKPVLATRVGGLIDGVIEGRTGWLVEPNSPQEIARAIQYINRKDTEAMVKGIDEFTRLHNWSNLAEKMVNISK